MGLGKTAQAAVAMEVTGCRTALVLGPAITRYSFARGVSRFSERSPRVRLLLSGSDAPEPGAVNIGSYSLLSQPKHRTALLRLNYDALVLDEAHLLKTPGAGRSQTVLGADGLAARSEHVWPMTGTPMPNHPGEMWTLLRTLFGEPLPYDDFLHHYCRVVEGEFGPKIVGLRAENAAELRDKLRPIMLRRTLEDVMSEMPPITWGDLELDWSAVLDQSDPGEMRKLGADPEIVAALEALKAGAEPPQDDHIARIRRQIGTLKARSVIAHINDEIAAGLDKIVVFFIYRDTGRLMREVLKGYRINHELIWGGQAPEAREQKLKRFRENWKCRVMLAQINAAGTGLDGLQDSCASVMIAEADWSPAANAQAVARVHRTGQKRPVIARFVSMAGTIDEDIQRVLRRKSQAIYDILGG